MPSGMGLLGAKEAGGWGHGPGCPSLHRGGRRWAVANCLFRALGQWPVASGQAPSTAGTNQVTRAGAWPAGPRREDCPEWPGLGPCAPAARGREWVRSEASSVLCTPCWPRGQCGAGAWSAGHVRLCVCVGGPGRPPPEDPCYERSHPTQGSHPRGLGSVPAARARSALSACGSRTRRRRGGGAGAGPAGGGRCAASARP